MALVPTQDIDLGFKAPDFNLPDTVSGNSIKPGNIVSDHGLIIMFICNHCPYVKHVLDELVKLGNEYIPKGIGMIAISSNDIVNYPEDAPENMKELALSMNFPFPYLYDGSQDVARAYHAACTPDFNIFDKDLNCVYRGQLDDSRPGNNIPVTGKDIRNVLDKLISGETIPTDQKPSIGCSIKWKQPN